MNEPTVTLSSDEIRVMIRALDDAAELRDSLADADSVSRHPDDRRAVSGHLRVKKIYKRLRAKLSKHGRAT